MTTSFRAPTKVLLRAPGEWLEGKYYPSDDFGEHYYRLTIQEASPGDRNAIDALPMGRRAGKYVRVYSDVRLNVVSQEPGGSPGDLVTFEGKWFLIVGESIFTALKRSGRNTPVSHYRYFAAEVIEHMPFERVP